VVRSADFTPLAALALGTEIRDVAERLARGLNHLAIHLERALRFDERDEFGHGIGVR
jgi:hypothetical protein